MKFVVDRKTWARGGRATWLENSDGTKCCLGFLGEACGISRKLLRDSRNPYEAFLYASSDGTDGTWPAGVLGESGLHSYAINEAIRLNDNKDLDDTRREEELKAIFATLGIEVEFTG